MADRSPVFELKNSRLLPEGAVYQVTRIVSGQEVIAEWRKDKDGNVVKTYPKADK